MSTTDPSPDPADAEATDADGAGGREANADRTDEAIEAVSPSAKLVYKVLEYEGPMTQEEIAAESRLCPRTVRYAVRKLEDGGLVTSRVSLADARRSVYELER